MPQRHYIRRWHRQSGRRVDHIGLIMGRLVITEWLGRWHDETWWKAVCECGKTVEVRVRPGNTMSCGCLNRERQRNHGWETQRTDGRWGLKNEKRLTLPNGTVTTVRELARQVGVHGRVMAKRIERWPPERWLEPPHVSGRRKREKPPKTEWHTHKQSRVKRPYASEIIRKVNAAGLNRRKVDREVPG